jgi:hypothetical protein
MEGLAVPDIYIHTYRQDPSRVIAACQAHMPDMRVFLITDGDASSYAHQPRIHFHERLKPQPNGGAWVKRWFSVALEQGSDVAIKMDPDSKVHRPFKTPLPDAQVFGALMDSPAIGRFIHGGAMCLRRSFMERALLLLDDPKFKGPHFTMKDGTASSDRIVADLAETLGEPLTPWTEVTYFPMPWENTRYAVSHGRWHKEPSLPAPRQPVR